MVDEDSSTSGGGKGLEAGGAARDRDPLEDAGEDAEPQQPAGLSTQRAEAGTENRSDRIAEILKQDQVVPRKQRHSAKRIFERIRDEGYSGGYTRVKEAVREIKQTRREEFVPLVHRPGETQVDFGHALAKAGGNLKKIVFFVMCLPHSDAVHVQAFPRICTEVLWEGHVRALRFFRPVCAQADHLRQRPHAGGRGALGGGGEFTGGTGRGKSGAGATSEDSLRNRSQPWLGREKVRQRLAGLRQYGGGPGAGD